MIPHQPGWPRYQAGQILVAPDTGRRYLVLHTGIEAYFVRWLNPPQYGPDEPREPLETAWRHEGCEDATHPEQEQT